MAIRLKILFLLGAFILGAFFYLTGSNQTFAQVGIPSGGVELDGFAWSSNVGWISMNCRTGGATGNDICATSNYKVTLQTDGTVTGYAWSSNVGWIRFGGLSGFPSVAGTVAVNARMTGTYPNLTFEGWARACAGDDMDSGCNPVVTVATSSSLIWNSINSPGVFKVETIGAGNSSNIVYGNSTYVALSAVNAILTSTDGLNWTNRAVPNMGSPWKALAFGNGAFVAVASGGASGQTRMIRSTDGINWTSTNPGIQVSWTSITYGNGLFVAVACGTGTGGTCNTSAGTRVVTSPDGITWTARTAPAALWNAVTYGNGLFVAVSESNGPNNVMTSPDGITWTARTAPNGMWGDVEYGNGRFVATAWSKVSNLVMTSPDGITWTSRSVTEEDGYTSLVFSSGLFVTAWYDTDKSGNPSSISTSPDGVTWTKQSYFEPGITGRWYSLGGSTNMIVGGSYYTTVSGLNFQGQLTASTSSYTGTGWDGWISLRSTAAPTHSIVMSSAGALLNSYAWGSTVLGWLNFDAVRFLTPTATLSGSNCTVAQGASTCAAQLNWTIDAIATAPNIYRATAPTSQLSTNLTGTNFAITLGLGNTTFQARDGSTVLRSATLAATCAAGLVPSGGICVPSVGTTTTTMSLSAMPPIVRRGNTTTINWSLSSLAGNTCVINGPGISNLAVGAVSGSVQTGPILNTATVRMTCTGSYGTAEERTTVEVIPVAVEV